MAIDTGDTGHDSSADESTGRQNATGCCPRPEHGRVAVLSSPVYAYGVNLLPAERVAEEAMRLNAQLAREVRETGATFTLDPLEQRLQELLRRSECKGIHSGDNG